MSTSTVLGYAARSVGTLLEPIVYDSPELGEMDVRVAITHCGVCYTDIHAIEDYYGITKYPFVPGHEIVGSVTELGNSVTTLKVGDRVGIGWQGRSCGHCEWCRQGEVQLCQDIADASSMEPYGGFATSITIDSRFAYRLPDRLPSEYAAVLMCAGLSVFNPLRKYALTIPQKLGIVGMGGLGHLAIQFAHHLNYEVTVISTCPDKKAEALAFGADDFILNEHSSLKRIDYGLDLLLVTSHGAIQTELLMMTLRKNGVFVLVGFPDLKFNSTDLVAHQLSITGAFLGNQATMREMLAFADSNAIRPSIEVMPMSKVGEALIRVRENKARYRIVLTNG
ncbi:MAG TPA: NAD(P)-dependent alcohol dehydrogenase [Bellilinea sp.]|nr:NAD(P)-dependent alcohol dehydrogenase [Bellilinea sp.]